MNIKSLLLLALGSTALAQNGNSPSLQDVLVANNSTLSSIVDLLSQYPAVSDKLRNATNITILAPNSKAVASFMNSTSFINDTALNHPRTNDRIKALLDYHILNGTYYISNLTSSSYVGTGRTSKIRRDTSPNDHENKNDVTTGHFIRTTLTNPDYANITGGQRVEAVPKDKDKGNATFYSALKEPSNIVNPDLNFTGGTIHVIDRVLGVPQNITTTFRDANLTAALGALEKSGLEQNVSRERDVTFFVPDNEAFARVASLQGNLSEARLREMVGYHVVEGRVLYSDMVAENGTLVTRDGGDDLNVRVLNGSLFVNNARVVVQDLFVSNGVCHVINNVLNPYNTTGAPNPTQSPPAPAFSNATSISGGGLPFTSGITGPETTAPVATEANPGGGAGGGGGGRGGEPTGTATATSTSTQGAMPMRTAGAGAAALFGAGVLAWHM